jgi:hypothetical protein
MTQNYNILSVRVYQAVKLHNKSQTHFTTVGSQNHKKVKIEILEGIGVLVKSENDAVIIPFPNISGIYLDTEQKKELREEREEDRNKPAKAKGLAKIKSDPKSLKSI